jgi:hypothetical protein
MGEKKNGDEAKDMHIASIAGFTNNKRHDEINYYNFRAFSFASICGCIW